MRKDKQVEFVFYFVGAVFIVWLSVLVAPCIHEGLFDAIIYLNEAMNSPFSFELCQDTLKCILISESIYSFSYLEEMRSMVRQNGRIIKLSIKNMLKKTTIPIRYFHRMFVLV